MNSLELSIENLKLENKKLFKLISKDYEYDCVIFVARGSFLIGQDLAELNNSPLLEICTKRKLNQIKKILRPILIHIPDKLKNLLRKKEFNSNYHKKNNNRKIFYNKKIWNNFIDKKKILIVDDSIDTGYTIKSVFTEVQNYFKNAEIRTAALNYFDKSNEIFKVDYYLYKNTILKAPWSYDSKEYNIFQKKINNWHKKQKQNFIYNKNR